MNPQPVEMELIKPNKVAPEIIVDNPGLTGEAEMEENLDPGD